MEDDATERQAREAAASIEVLLASYDEAVRERALALLESAKARPRDSAAHRFVGLLLRWVATELGPESVGGRYLLVWYAVTHGKRRKPEQRLVSDLLKQYLSTNELRAVRTIVRQAWDSTEDGNRIKSLASRLRKDFIDSLTDEEREEHRERLRCIVPPIPELWTPYSGHQYFSIGAQWFLVFASMILADSNVRAPGYAQDPSTDQGRDGGVVIDLLDGDGGTSGEPCPNALPPAQRKRCYLDHAARLRGGSDADSERLYRAALSIDYDPKDESEYLSLEALDGLASLQARLGRMKEAAKTYDAFYSRKVALRHGESSVLTGDDCAVLVYLRLHVSTAQDALELHERCLRLMGPAMTVSSLYSYPAGLAYERQDHLGDALATYLGARESSKDERWKAWWMDRTWQEVIDGDGLFDDIDARVRAIKATMTLRGHLVEADGLLVFLTRGHRVRIFRDATYAPSCDKHWPSDADLLAIEGGARESSGAEHLLATDTPTTVRIISVDHFQCYRRERNPTICVSTDRITLGACRS